MPDGRDLVERAAHVRIRPLAVGCEDHVMAEGRVVGFRDHPSVEIEDGQGKRSWWALSAVGEVAYRCAACKAPIRRGDRCTACWRGWIIEEDTREAS